jgi:Na+/melibiose symporter-like transporter
MLVPITDRSINQTKGNSPLKNRTEAMLVMVFSALIAAQAVYYFISGESTKNTTTWNIFVILQLAIAISILTWSWRKSKSFSEKSGPNN